MAAFAAGGAGRRKRGVCGVAQPYNPAIKDAFSAFVQELDKRTERFEKEYEKEWKERNRPSPGEGGTAIRPIPGTSD
jgi:hypothetical protein